MRNHAWISFYVAADLLDIILQEYTWKNGLCVRIFSIFVMTIDLYDFLMNERGSEDKQNPQHRNQSSHLPVFHKQKETFIQWLKKIPVYVDTQKYFKVHVYQILIAFLNKTAKLYILVLLYEMQMDSLVFFKNAQNALPFKQKVKLIKQNNKFDW